MVVCTSGNAIIIKDDGKMITYKHKCPNCGQIGYQERLCGISSGRVKQCFGASCSNCHKNLGDFEFERR